MQINVYEAKTQLSKLLARVAAGEEIVIARAGRPVARLVPVGTRPERKAGGWAGRWVLVDGWDDPAVNAEIARTFDASAVGRVTEEESGS